MPLLDAKKAEFIECYSEYYQIVYGAIYSKVADKHDIEDLIQEVFLIFYQKIDEIANKRSWLFGTVQNVLMNYYRKKRKFSSDADIADYLNDVSLGTINGFRDTRMLLEDAMASLTEKDRILFDLVAVQQLTYHVAARHLGLTRRQVAYRYSSIIGTIKAYLNERGIRGLGDLL
jgi:RNA polymerase sigma-70 factor (ECF subfamily)